MDSLVGDHVFSITTSIGIAISQQNSQSFEDLILKAEAALDEAKYKGGNQFQLFTDEMDKKARQKILIENELKNAFKRKEFYLEFQPKVTIGNQFIVGAEALIRWKSPTLGQVSPSNFIPVAEEIGLINELGFWIIEESCHEISRLCDLGWCDFRLSVNLSAHQLRQPHLFEVVKEYLDKYSIKPELLELELTESMLMQNSPSPIEMLNAFKSIGVSLSLDDFGTGFSSLSYLKNFPIDTLKIDKSFIDSVHLNKNDAAIVLAIISLAKSLGMNVIAEGVEIKEQLDFLEANHCDQMQGYYFSKPLKQPDFEQLLLKFLDFGHTNKR
jgi:EAL domain-containing protein (putative c-di-GMP-specific phosphodiesterase class I)